MRLTVVVPCFNEEEVIAQFHEAVSRQLVKLGHPYEILYVDDGSQDGTLELLMELSAEDPKARYLALSRNFGKESAMLAGLRHADGDAMVIMDADLQDPPELIGRMLHLHAKGFDQVIARRTRSGEPVGKTMLAKVYYWAVNRWADVELLDGVRDFRLLSRRATDALTALDESNRFSKGLFAWIGFESVVIEYENVRRSGGQSKWSIPKLVEYGVDGLVSFNNKPLRLAIYLGMLLTLIAAGYTGWLVISAVFSGIDTPGFLTLIVAVVGMGGVLMVMLGVIGEYIGRIYSETKRRPHYLIKDTNVSRR